MMGRFYPDEDRIEDHRASLPFGERGCIRAHSFGGSDTRAGRYLSLRDSGHTMAVVTRPKWKGQREMKLSIEYCVV